MTSSFDAIEWCKRSQYLKWAWASDQLIPMGSGEHDFPPKNAVFRHVRQAIAEGYSAYGPLKGLPEVRFEVSQFQSTTGKCPVPAEHVLPVPSGSIALALITNALVDCSDHVLFIGDPVYYAVIRPVISAGVQFSICPFTHDGAVDFNLVSTFINDDTRAIYIVNPHSPTGKLFTIDELHEIGDICQANRLTLISDDVYQHFVLEGEYVPCYRAHKYLYENSYVVGSYAKCFNVAGVCASFVVASPRCMEIVENYYGGPVFMTSIYSQLVLRGCIENSDWIVDLRNKLQRSRDLLVSGLGSISSLEFERPKAGMFLWVTFDIEDEESVGDILLNDCRIEVQSNRSFFGSKKNQARLNFGTYESTIIETIRRLSSRFS